MLIEQLTGYTALERTNKRLRLLAWLLRRKGFPYRAIYATTLGPWLVTPDELHDRQQGEGAETRYNLAMSASVNGKALSQGNANTLTHTFAQMIEWASTDVWLRPGDVLGSGTVGTGCILELRPENTGGWLKPGDVVEMEIEGLGVIRNRLVNAV